MLNCIAIVEKSFKVKLTNIGSINVLGSPECYSRHSHLSVPQRFDVQFGRGVFSLPNVMTRDFFNIKKFYGIEINRFAPFRLDKMFKFVLLGLYFTLSKILALTGS